MKLESPTRGLFPGVWSEHVRPWVELSLRLAGAGHIEGIPLEHCETDADMRAYIERLAKERPS